MPAALDKYDKYMVDGITIYIQKDIKTVNGQFHFKLDKLLMFEKVIVHGLDLDFERR